MSTVIAQKWAAMITSINTNFVNPPPSYKPRVEVDSGIDMENGFSPDGYAAEQWDRTYGQNSTYRNYNYGDCEACFMPSSTNPYANTPGPVPDTTASSRSWNLEAIYQVSFGIQDAYPLPEIYAEAGGNAYQWQGMVFYAAKSHPSGPMQIDGALTQRQACADSVNPAGDADHNTIEGAQICQGTANTPGQGWLQLWCALNVGPSAIVTSNSTSGGSMSSCNESQYNQDAQYTAQRAGTLTDIRKNFPQIP